jgi:beta-lactamase regulating signal transducer with metallopeptidase domain
MPVLIIYLLKINIALLLFYLAYRFALRRLTFYTLNRFFLVVGIIFSTAYPFIDLSKIFRNHTEINDKLIVIVPDWSSVEKAVLPVASFNYWQLIIAVFWTGVSVMAVRLFIQFISLYQIHRSSKREVINNQVFRRSNKTINPFSFWQNIYLNPAQHQLKELEAILQHERIHVEEWHTLDILIAELSVVFYWFNPGVWLMKQAVKENLEFITDLKVLNSGVDSKTYQYSLTRMIFQPQSHSLINNFNFISVKKRIMMMNKKQSPKIQVSRYLLILPVVIVLTFVFTVSKAQLEKKQLKKFTQNSFSAIKKVLSSVNSVPSALSQAANSFRQETQPIINEIFSEKETLTVNSFAALEIDPLNKELNSGPAMSLRAPADINIDGKPSEWNNQFQVFNENTEIFYTISNDNDNLYLKVKATNIDIINKIICGGVTLTINDSGAMNDQEGKAITFPTLDKDFFSGNEPPIYLDRPWNMQADSFIVALNRQLTSRLKNMRVTGVAAIPNHLLPIDNSRGIKAKALVDNEMNFTYELAMPLKYLGLSVNQKRSFFYNIRLTGMNPDWKDTSSIVRAMRAQREEFKDRFRNFAVLVAYGPDAPSLHYFSPTDLSGTYALAK